MTTSTPAPVLPALLPLVKPQVNLNGTSREQLVEQQCDVMAALRAVTAAMGEASPNGRDYQLRPAEYQGAREAWTQRMIVIARLYDEIEQHALAIQEG